METHQLKPAAIGSVRASSQGGGGARRRPTRSQAEGRGARAVRRQRIRAPPALPGPAAGPRRRTRRGPWAQAPAPGAAPGAKSRSRRIAKPASDRRQISAPAPSSTVLPPGIKCLVPAGGERKSRARAGHVDPTWHTLAPSARRLHSYGRDPEAILAQFHPTKKGAETQKGEMSSGKLAAQLGAAPESLRL